MPYMLIRHKVQDYAKWKSAFDDHGSTREASGSKGGTLFRSAENPSETISLFEWDDLDRARQFIQSDDLREAMQSAGVADQPDIYFLDEVERLSA